MEENSSHLVPIRCSPEGLPIYFLTGKKYLYQTLFCITSLVKVSKQPFRYILIDDGTFDREIITRINSFLPGVEIVMSEDIEKNLSKVIPKHLFPTLHYKRGEYPHIKKLIDVHTLPGNKWKLVLDSDMLFWNDPIEIVNWLNAPDKPLYMLDCENSYGYSSELMESLCGFKVKQLINVGAIGLNSEEIDWTKIENWIRELESAEGKTYYLEQALSAMLIGQRDSLILDKSNYVVNPSEEEIRDTHGILHHYVDLSKKGYFEIAWKKFI